jgi:hypothetical protein
MVILGVAGSNLENNRVIYAYFLDVRQTITKKKKRDFPRDEENRSLRHKFCFAITY